MPTTSKAGLRYPDQTYAVDVASDMANLANDVDAPLGRLITPPAGRGAQVNGAQELVAAPGKAIALVNDFVQGGMVWSTANGGGLQVPTAGIYLVTMVGYFSGNGTGGYYSIQALRWRSGTSTIVADSRIYKPSGADDYIANGSTLLRLSTSDIITLKAFSSGGSASWGDSGMTGTQIAVSKLGL